MDTDKKIAAAIAAVSMYLEAEQQALYAQAAADQPPAVTQRSMNIWGVGGRQAMMQMRNLMQMKGFHGSRF
jgi:hypothetical protein